MVVDLGLRRTGESDSGVRAALTDSAEAQPLNDPVVVPMYLASVRTARWLRVALLAITDTVCVVTAAVVAFAVWARGVLGQPAAVYWPLLPVLALVPVVNAASGLYPGFGLGPIEMLRRQWRGVTGVFLALVASTFVFKLPPVYSRATWMLAWLGALALLPAARSALFRLLGRQRWWSEPVVVVGPDTWVVSLVRRLHLQTRAGYRPVAVLAPSHEGSIAETTLPGLSLESAPSLAAAGIRVALLAETEAGTGSTILARLHQSFTQVIVLGGAGEMPVEHAEVRNVGGLLGVEYTNELLRPRNRLIKRALDLTLGTAALVLATPVIAFAAVLVKLSNRGPAFFSHEREGLDGRRIRMPKLRTMFVDAEQRLQAHLDADPTARREWEDGFKLARDPRVIPGVGSLLRRMSLDELPQLWSVVRGEMSLVGPRPFPDYHLERFPAEFRALRRRVRPGITGLWQVMVRSEGGLEDQQAYDTYYIRNWSLWMDLYILARTLEAVVRAHGAY